MHEYWMYSMIAFIEKIIFVYKSCVNKIILPVFSWAQCSVTLACTIGWHSQIFYFIICEFKMYLIKFWKKYSRSPTDGTGERYRTLGSTKNWQYDFIYTWYVHNYDFLKEWKHWIHSIFIQKFLKWLKTYF